MGHPPIKPPSSRHRAAATTPTTTTTPSPHPRTRPNHPLQRLTAKLGLAASPNISAFPCPSFGPAPASTSIRWRGTPTRAASSRCSIASGQWACGWPSPVAGYGRGDVRCRPEHLRRRGHWQFNWSSSMSSTGRTRIPASGPAGIRPGIETDIPGYPPGVAFHHDRGRLAKGDRPVRTSPPRAGVPAEGEHPRSRQRVGNGYRNRRRAGPTQAPPRRAPAG